MAIKIPSAKIYEIENPKIRDNLIDYIEAKGVSMFPVFKVKTPVSNEKFSTKDKTLISRNQDKKDYQYIINGGGTYDNANALPFVETFAYIRIQARYVRLSYFINKQQTNSYVTKLYDKLDEAGVANIKFQATCLKYNGTCSYPVKFVRDYLNDEFDATINGDPTHTFDLPNGYEQLPYPPSGKITITEKLEYKGQYNENAVAERTSTAELNFNDGIKADGIYTNLGEKGITEYSTRFGLDGLYVMVSATIDTISSSYKDILTYFVNENKNIKGTSVYYAPESVTITFQGDEKGLGIEEITIPIPTEKGSNPFEIEGSELLQSTNYIGSEDTNALTKHYTDLISQYANGKETATIRCSISDYYDENGTKIVSSDNSTNKMTFDIYDEVIPMVYTNDGDVPMSTYADGTPKVFKVLGVVPDYRGAVYQKLYLQEI